MSKLDVYLRSIEKFGATGAVLTSGAAVTLKFPTGDRNATQVVPHDQLVPMVREVAPPAALDQIDKQRPASFAIESGGFRYSLSVTPRPGSWQVVIDGMGTAGGAPQAIGAQPSRPVRAQSAPVDGGEMEIERGQYDAAPDATTTAAPTSGSAVLDALTTQARGQRATDIYLAAGAVPLVRVGGELIAMERGAFDSETLSRELGVVAPADARNAWHEGQSATFAYGDGAGRVRVTLSRDRRGPGAALRLLHGEAPALERLGLGDEVTGWLSHRGLVLVAGASGSGKTTLLGALVRSLGENRRGVVVLEDPIELLHSGPTISQRAIGEHARTAAAGVIGAMREGVNAIVVGTVDSADTARAVVDAVAGGHLVLVTVTAPGTHALATLLGYLPGADREHAGQLCTQALLGTITAVNARSGRSYEVVSGASV